MQCYACRDRSEHGFSDLALATGEFELQAPYEIREVTQEVILYQSTITR